MKKAAVIGYPIKHSLSPKLHSFWLRKHNIEGEYGAIAVEAQNLELFFEEGFFEKGLQGVNITVPHKETAYEIIKKIGKLTDIAKKIKAINTVYLEDGILVGTNTDYYGFKNAFLNGVEQGFSFKNKRILIIGAGGAARAIVGGLALEQEVAKIIIANRTVQKADNLAKEFVGNIEAVNLVNLEDSINEVDIVVNSSSCGLNGENDLVINHQKIRGVRIYNDIVYKPLITKFLADAQEARNSVITGESMLAYQAVPAFRCFFW